MFYPENGAMPKYRCHKEVWALKILAIEVHRPTIEDLQKILDGGGESPAATITPEGSEPFDVTTEYMQRHSPQVGGYFVEYEDGYRSYSPGPVFEGGYTRI